MERVEISAGFLAAHRYDELSQSLTIEFRDGRKWTHANVPPDVYEELRTTDLPMLIWAVKIRQPLDVNLQKKYPVVNRHGG